MPGKVGDGMLIDILLVISMLALLALASYLLRNDKDWIKDWVRRKRRDER